MIMDAKKFATYEDIMKAPDNVIAEIIDGELYTHPRPSRKHSRSAYKFPLEALWM
jgi:hypothetical protein